MIDEKISMVLFSVFCTLVYLLNAALEGKYGKERILTSKARASMFLLVGCQWFIVFIFSLTCPIELYNSHKIWESTFHMIASILLLVPMLFLIIEGYLNWCRRF